MKTKLIIWSIVITLSLNFTIKKTYADCSCEGKDGYEKVLSYFEGEPIYSNGACTGKGNCGDYQCVEFVKRVYTNIFNVTFNHAWGSAWNGWDVGLLDGLSRYENGGSEKPQRGDILVFDGGTDGHVGIVSEVGNSYIIMMDQNRSSTDATIQYSYNPTTNRIEHDNLKGWLRAIVGYEYNESKGYGKYHGDFTPLFSDAYSTHGSSSFFGAPWNNPVDGGDETDPEGKYVHLWGETWVQDFWNEEENRWSMLLLNEEKNNNFT